jgi:FkbM family methyltransferase
MKKLFLDCGPGVKNAEYTRKDMWEGYTIIGLEPDPIRYKNIKDEFPGILLNLAVSDQEGEINGILHPTSGFIAGGYPGCDNYITVKAVTLDSIYEEYGPFSSVAIWADIEGSELKMLQGATEVLKKTDWITVELHTHPKTEEWCKSKDVYDFLENLGFTTNTKMKPETEHDSCYDATFVRI